MNMNRQKEVGEGEVFFLFSFFFLSFLFFSVFLFCSLFVFFFLLKKWRVSLIFLQQLIFLNTFLLFMYNDSCSCFLPLFLPILFITWDAGTFTVVQSSESSCSSQNTHRQNQCDFVHSVSLLFGSVCTQWHKRALIEPRHPNFFFLRTERQRPNAWRGLHDTRNRTLLSPRCCVVWFGAFMTFLLSLGLVPFGICFRLVRVLLSMFAFLVGLETAFVVETVFRNPFCYPGSCELLFSPED